MKRGQLYIIYPKNGESKYKMQFHFESKSFANKYDEVYNKPLDCIDEVVEDEDVLNELIALCKKVFAKNRQYVNYFLQFEEALEFIQIELKNGAKLKEIFDGIGDFHDGFALVFLKGKYNYISTENKILRNDLWFDMTWDFYNGLAKVYMKDRGWNWINTDGKILRDDLWFDNVDDFYNGYAIVKIKGKGWNYINTDGKILRDDLWFDKIGDFKGGLASVKIEGKDYKLDTNGIVYNMYGKRVDI